MFDVYDIGSITRAFPVELESGRVSVKETLPPSQRVYDSTGVSKWVLCPNVPTISTLTSFRML